MNTSDSSALSAPPQAIGPAYYNEIEPYAAAWLHNLIAANLITPGTVDERDIRDVRPSELAGYTRCHFFAGIGVWDYALGLAGWPADREVWTGSCPCQPFSAAGKGGGFDDERHLWPAWHHLIRECRPRTVLGEQVASKDGLGWLDLVHADLEGEGYAVGAADLCAAGVGAPHIRQRLWFVANACDERRAGQHALLRSEGAGRRGAQAVPEASRRSAPCDMADSECLGRERRWAGETSAARREEALTATLGLCDAGLVGDSRSGWVRGRHEHRSDAGSAGEVRGEVREQRVRTDARAAGPVGFWSDADWIACRDGKARPVEPGTFPLAHGAPARVGRLRAYGNAICAEAARAFIGAVLDAAPPVRSDSDAEHFRLTAASVSSVTSDQPLQDIFA
jgi:DNA (cytosine-5)-methyltransferase 1